MSKFISGNRNRVWILGLLLVLLLIPVLSNALIESSNYLMLMGCFIFLYIIAESGLNVLFGYCGQISIGHAAFFAIGAYGSALLNNFTGVSTLITAVVASVIAAGVGSLVALAASRLKFHFLSLATIAFGQVIYNLSLYSPGGVTGDAVGLFCRPMDVFGFELSSYTAFYYFALAAMIIFFIGEIRLVKSKMGRAFMAIRDNSHAANGMGVNVVKYKVTAFAVSAFYVGFAGAMYAHLIGYITPNNFLLTQSVMFLTMLLLGGKGTLVGPVIGVLVVQMVNEGIRMFEQYSTIVYGIMLLAVVLLLPSGLAKFDFKGVYNKFFKKGGRDTYAGT